MNPKLRTLPKDILSIPMVGMEINAASQQTFKYSPEKRAKMRSRERRYLNNHPDKYATKLHNNKKRYQDNPEFRAQQLERVKARYERLKAARLTAVAPASVAAITAEPAE